MQRDKERQRIIDAFTTQFFYEAGDGMRPEPKAAKEMIDFLDKALLAYAQHKVMQQRMLVRNHINLRNIPNPKFTREDDKLSDGQ
jgi:hypothetical protein